MRSLFFILLLGAVARAQSSSTNAPPTAPSSSSGSNHANRKPSLAPPRSDSVSAADLENDTGDSSSKEDPVDLSPPAGDVKAHSKDSDILTDEGSGGEFHPWDPHKASKDVEVGDFYFKKKNYTAAESRYREALYYKENDAVATYRLAVCLEKLERPDEARSEYESYLKILPYGPEAADAKKAIERLSTHAASDASPK
jgi:tetratricopeptide (TPR) repeat protein